MGLNSTLQGDGWHVDPITSPPVLAHVDPVTGGIATISVGGSAANIPLARVPNILFYGDSIPGYGYDYRIFGVMTSSTTPYGGAAFSVIGVSWSSGSTTGTLNFDKTAKTLKWSPAAGGGFGPVTDVSRAGVYDIQGPTAGQYVRVVCRPRYYSAATEGDFSVVVTANTERYRMGAKNIAHWARSLQGGAFNAYILSNGGSTVADITEATWQIPVLASQLGVTFDEIVVIAGTNDITADRSLANMKTDYAALMTACRQYAPVVRAVGILPRSASMSAARRQIKAGFNRWLHSELAMGGVIPVNADPAVLDVTNANGDPISLAFEDGLHPATSGAYRIGKIIGQNIMAGKVARLAYESTSLADTYDATNNPKGNAIAAYSGFTGTGGTAGTGTTGSVPDGWRTERVSGSAIACTVSTAARPDGLPGNALKMVLTNATDTGIFALRLAASVSVTAGETWQAKHKVYVESSSGLEVVELFIDPNLSGQKRAEAGSGAISGTTIPTSADYLLLETPPLLIDSGITSVNIWFQVRLSSTGSATVWVMPGEPTLRRN